MRKLREIHDGTFEAEVEQAEGLIAVDFTAAWCGPCRVLTPVLERLAEEYGERLKFVELDTDLNPATPVRFGVRSLPTVLFFRDGVVVDRSVGALPAPAIRARIERNLAPTS